MRDALAQVGWRLRDIATFAGMSLRALARLAAARRPAPARDTRGGPVRGLTVVVVPGILETGAFMAPIADELRRRGYDARVVDTLGLNLGPVPVMAQRLWAFIQDLDAPAVVVVAHSKGGLIGKYAMVNDDETGRIKRLVAVNTPFGGSAYARLVPLPGLEIFRPGSSLLQTLHGNESANHRILSAYSFFDPHIPEGCDLDGATNVTLRTPGHFRVLRGAELRDVVLRAVDDVARTLPVAEP